MRPKILNTSIILSVLFACNQVEVKNNDLTKRNINGQVKSIKTINFDCDEKNGKIIKAKVFIEAGLIEDIFNKNGFLIQTLSYSSLDSIETIKNYKYDSNGRLIEHNTKYSNIMDTRHWKVVYSYDDAGNLIEENCYWLNDTNAEKIRDYKYNNKGQMIERNEYVYSGDFDPYGEFKLREKTRYNYNESGNIQDELFCELNGEIRFKNSFNYENNIKVSEENEYGITNYRYDYNINIIEEYTKYKDGDIERRNFK